MIQVEVEKKLSERILADVETAPWVVEEVKKLEASIVQKETELTQARIEIHELNGQVEDLQDDCCDDKEVHQLKEVSGLLEQILRQGHLSGTLDDVGREALHFMRSEGLISW